MCCQTATSYPSVSAIQTSGSSMLLCLELAFSLFYLDLILTLFDDSVGACTLRIMWWSINSGICYHGCYPFVGVAYLKDRNLCWKYPIFFLNVDSDVSAASAQPNLHLSFSDSLSPMELADWLTQELAVKGFELDVSQRQALLGKLLTHVFVNLKLF